MYWPNLKSVAVTFPEIIPIEDFEVCCEPQSWGRGGPMGVWMVPFEKALVSSYRLGPP